MMDGCSSESNNFDTDSYKNDQHSNFYMILINYILILDQKVIENSTEEVKYGLGTQVLKQLGSFQIIIYKSNGYI